MNEAINNIAGEMRERLYAGEFQCLDAYLSCIANLCYADAAGLVAVHEGRLRVQFSVGTPFEQLRKDIQLKLSSLHKRSKWQTDDSLGLWTNDGKYLLLRKIWLSSAWPQMPQESFWLYLLDPKAVIPPKDAANTQLVDQFGGIVSAFIRWSNELFVRHDEMLSSELDDPKDVLREFKKFLVRPVLPVQFREILDRFNPKNCDASQWAKEIEAIKSICIKPKAPGACRCQVVGGQGVDWKCPQTPENDQVISVLAKLEFWRTGFWKFSVKKRTDEHWHPLLSTAIEGLAEAAELLHWQDAEKKTAH